MRDYYISVDENGQPYIEHGFLDRVKGSKYYQKIKTAYGTRYFYDPEEWKAYVEGRGNKPTSLVGKAKDKLGFDERQRYKNTNDQFMKAYNSNPNSDKTRELAVKAHNLNVKYNNTALGTAEYAAGRVKEAVGDVGTAFRDKATRMREEFQKRNNAQYSEFDENDPDFSDESYDKAERIGDSDFLIRMRPDGRAIILEEDQKWVLPKGVDIHSPAFLDAVKTIEEHWAPGGSLSSQWPNNNQDKVDGKTYGETWNEDVTNIINAAVRKARK